MKIDKQLENSLERAWLEKEEKNSLEKMKTLDLGEWEIDARKLKVNKIIGEGVYGSVYQGVYQKKKVAVKVFHMTKDTRRFELRNSFVQEVSLSKDLDHPNIIKFIGAMKNMLEVDIKDKKSQDFDNSQDYCMVTEFLSGGTLYEYLQKRDMKKLPISIVIRLALDAAKGLSYLHSKKIMHRDVKTENMLLDKNGRLKIIDFGVSGVEDIIEHTPDTGTLGYMAPEVFAGQPYDRKCDVYSFGICLCEIYCCLMPYDLISMYDAIKDSPNLYKNLKKEIPSGCPSVLVDLMQQCWDIDPKKRPEMATVVRILKEFEASVALDKGIKGRSRLLCLG